jgi:hypothetical protein
VPKKLGKVVRKAVYLPIGLAVERAKELEIKQMITSSDTGYSALKLMKALQDSGLKNVKVVVHASEYGMFGRL